jgi:hypothetical protein
MKGVYSKEAIRSIVEPLRAISSVFSNISVHVVYEMEDETIHISTMNQKKSVFAMYELKAKKIIENYQPLIKEIGIWDVKQFVNILGKYENDIYANDVTIDCQKEKLVISCGNETTDYYLSQLHLFEDSKGKARKLKTDVLTEAAKFELAGVDLKKVLANINVFDDQNQLTLVGVKGKGVIVRLTSESGSVFNKNEMTLADVEVKEDFTLKYQKADFKGLLVCNNKFNFTVYTGKKQIVNATYEKDNYTMNFYFAPLVD